MPKAYWVAHITVLDDEIYSKYVSLTREAFVKYNAIMLARGGKYTVSMR